MHRFWPRVWRLLAYTLLTRCDKVSDSSGVHGVRDRGIRTCLGAVRSGNWGRGRQRRGGRRTISPTQPITQPSPHWPPQYGEPPASVPRSRATASRRRGRRRTFSSRLRSRTGRRAGDAPASAPAAAGIRAAVGPGISLPATGAKRSRPRFRRWPRSRHRGISCRSIASRQPEADAAGFRSQLRLWPAGLRAATAVRLSAHGAPQQPEVAPEQQGATGGQQADPRGFDLGNYMSAPGQQGYAQPEAAPFPVRSTSRRRSPPRRATARPMPNSTRPWPRTRRSRAAAAAA